MDSGCKNPQRNGRSKSPVSIFSRILRWICPWNRAHAFDSRSLEIAPCSFHRSVCVMIFHKSLGIDVYEKLFQASPASRVYGTGQRSQMTISVPPGQNSLDLSNCSTNKSRKGRPMHPHPRPVMWTMDSVPILIHSPAVIASASRGSQQRRRMRKSWFRSASKGSIVIHSKIDCGCPRLHCGSTLLMPGFSLRMGCSQS